MREHYDVEVFFSKTNPPYIDNASLVDNINCTNMYIKTNIKSGSRIIELVDNKGNIKLTVEEIGSHYDYHGHAHTTDCNIRIANEEKINVKTHTGVPFNHVTIKQNGFHTRETINSYKILDSNEVLIAETLGKFTDNFARIYVDHPDRMNIAIALLLAQSFENTLQFSQKYKEYAYKEMEYHAKHHKPRGMLRF